MCPIDREKQKERKNFRIWDREMESPLRDWDSGQKFSFLFFIFVQKTTIKSRQTQIFSAFTCSVDKWPKIDFSSSAHRWANPMSETIGPLQHYSTYRLQNKFRRVDGKYIENFRAIFNPKRHYSVTSRPSKTIHNRMSLVTTLHPVEKSLHHYWPFQSDAGNDNQSH